MLNSKSALKFLFLILELELNMKIKNVFSILLNKSMDQRAASIKGQD